MKPGSAERQSIDRPFAQSVAEVLGRLDVDSKRGLSDREVAERRAAVGPNSMPSAKPKAAWRMFAEQFASILVLLLVVAATVSFASGDSLEGIAIVVVVLLNAAVGFLTEFRAKVALDSLKLQAKTHARVRREGREENLDAEELVPGDIVVLEAGDRVPADLRLVQSAAMRAEESALTGESVPTEKSVESVAEDALIAERSSMVYLGTSIVAGHALAAVTATGLNTELGKIGKLVTQVEEGKTPLEARLNDLGKRLALLVVGIALLVFAIGVLRGTGAMEMVRVAISLSVAAIPEGLPAVTTLVLALGVLNMARQNAIVRRLVAVEALGGVTVIATDKTGTLTENRMKVRLISFAGSREVEIHRGIEMNEAMNLAVRIGSLCNDAHQRSQTDFLGDPTEIALLEMARDLDVELAELRFTNPRIREVPFDSGSKRMVTVNRTPEGDVAHAKGAPSAIVEICDHFIDVDGKVVAFTGESGDQLLEANRRMAGEALRVLGLAYKPLGQNPDLDSGFIFVGFAGLIDPPRPEVRESIQVAQHAGIRVVMMTGDQLMTGQAIAREVGMGDQPLSYHAKDLAGASPVEIAEIARNAKVFARVSPEDKLRIVEALQASGEVVAVTGDGVNDAPALKRADIGVAMGIRGTEVAKEAADVVLLDDNFATIVRAVEAGRTIYANILKFVQFLFTCNLAEVVVVFAAAAFGLPLPLFPLAILWVNLLTDVFPAFALAVEPSEPDTMRLRPRPPEQALLSREFAIRVVAQSTLIGFSALLAYGWALGKYGEGPHARTVALLALVGVQVSQLFVARSRTRSGIRSLFKSPAILWSVVAMVGLQFVAVYVPVIANALGIASANAGDWLVAVLAAGIPLAIDEAIKAIVRKRSRRQG